MDHLRLDRAVAEVLPVEVLRTVAHSVASITDHWDFDVLVTREALIVASFGRGHSNLHARGKSRELICCTNIAVLKARTQGVDIKERVFPMLNLGHRLAVE